MTKALIRLDWQPLEDYPVPGYPEHQNFGATEEVVDRKGHCVAGMQSRHGAVIQGLGRHGAVVQGPGHHGEVVQGLGRHVA